MLSTLQEKDGKVVVPSIGLAIDGRFSVEKEPMICANGLKNVSRENVNLGEKHFGKSLCNQLSMNWTKLRQKIFWQTYDIETDFLQSGAAA